MKFYKDEIDPERREFVLKALAAGVFSSGFASASLAAANSIHTLRGDVRINGAAASAASAIKGGDLVETGSDGGIIFTVAKDAFILRSNSRLQLTPPAEDNTIVEGLRMFTGALLSVFGSRRHRIDTPYATVGIRGTGVYVEVEPERDYICTCYGITEVAASDDPNSSELVDAGHHSPRYVLKPGSSGQRIQEAPVVNHTDAELTLIESLVGRVPEFDGNYDDYSRPRRRNY